MFFFYVIEMVDVLFIKNYFFKGLEVLFRLYVFCYLEGKMLVMFVFFILEVCLVILLIFLFLEFLLMIRLEILFLRIFLKLLGIFLMVGYLR